MSVRIFCYHIGYICFTQQMFIMCTWAMFWSYNSEETMEDNDAYFMELL